MKQKLFHLFIFLMGLQLSAQTINIIQTEGWFESGYITWTPIEGVDFYKVYYSGNGISDQLIDTQLVRNYGTYFRADVLGLAPGSYTFKVSAVINGIEGDASVSNSIVVSAHERNGFAHANGKIPGAYNLDGTVKANAVILYITNENKNTISLNVTGATTNPCVGLQTILDGFKKGNDNRPLIIRLIGNITPFSYMYNGDIVIENKNNVNGSITLEGVGEDALANGWGIRLKKASNVEVRNLGWMLTASGEGDNIGLQQDNDYIWIHHNDLFYGLPGNSSDQAKGDGALDVKRSGFVTIGYNHFWDTGKSNLLGNGTETPRMLTYHHNWYDHSDSRHPRVRSHTVHIYNNYYDGVSKYGAGSTRASSLFMEGNYFRNCKYPMLISKQGSDIAGGSPGTFSGEPGGIIKAWNNYMIGQQAFAPYHPTTNPAQFDAYVATTRNEIIGSNVGAFLGGANYNNFDTNPAYYVNNFVADTPEVAKEKVIQFSGRMNGGDISFTFNNAVDDNDFGVNAALMAVLNNYTSSLISVQGITTTVVSSQTLSIPNNNDQVVNEGTAIVPMIFTWGGTASDVEINGLPANGVDFVKNMTAKTVTVSGIPTDDVDFTITTIGTSGVSVSGSGSISIGVPNDGDMIHNFTVSQLNSSFYSFTSANMNSNPGSTTYDGLTLTARLKIETPTKINYTTSAESTLTLVFDPTFNGIIKLNGINYTANGGVAIIESVPAGANEITKGGTTNLYYMKTEYTMSNSSFDKKSISVYPNPVSYDLNILISNDQIIENIYIFNMMGSIVKTFKGHTTQINLSNLSSGVYMLKIQTNEGIIDQKIIKN